MNPINYLHHLSFDRADLFAWISDSGALLELALINWAMQKLVKRGFTPVLTPEMVSSSPPVLQSMRFIVVSRISQTRAGVTHACGFQPRNHDGSAHSQTFAVPPCEPNNLVVVSHLLRLACWMFAD